MKTPQPAPISWTNTLFLLSTHAVALVGTILYATMHGVTLGALGLMAFYLVACGFSVTAGYHRLFAHGSYQAQPLLRLFYLLFGAATFENSALKWAMDHRRHHAFVDEENDPYNIQKGFWWAHMGWLFFKDSPSALNDKPEDLNRDPLVCFQHRFYVPLAIGMGFGIPLGIGFLLNDPWGGLILAGFLRMILLYHATFCVNSLAHTLGTQPYSNTNSSRDSALTAFITLGEGYHNFHHTFPFDYRNGVRVFQFDPTKWFIRGLNFLKLTQELVRTPDEVILKKRLEMQERHAALRWMDRPQVVERLHTLRGKLEGLLNRAMALKGEWAELRARVDRRSHASLQSLRRKMWLTRCRLRETYRMWRLALREPNYLLLPAR